MSEKVNKFRLTVGKRISKNVKFMGEDIQISKLSISEVEDVQAKAKAVDEKDSKSAFIVIKEIVRKSVEGASDLSDEDFQSFPLDDLAKLSNEIMEYSGMAGGK
jgi:hypothetical protein